MIAVLIAAVGGIATVGFEPVINLARFEYTTLALSLAGALIIVYRLGAGLHGLGTRGMPHRRRSAAVLLGVTLAYAELLRRYGTPGLVEWIFDGVRWTRAELGAFPRPIEALLGVPALVWGSHMRARRRQGWWVCAFGVAATAPVANARSTPRSPGPSALAGGPVRRSWSASWSGFLLIRVDVALTGAAWPAWPAGRGGHRRSGPSPRGPSHCSRPRAPGARRGRQRGRDSNPRLTSLPATAFKAVPIGHSGTPPSGRTSGTRTS